MVLKTKLHLAFSVIGLIIICCKIYTVSAACKGGSVIFYWKVAPAERSAEKKNYGTLEKEIKGNRPKLGTYMNTDYTYAFKIQGICCWEVYSENGYKGESAKLEVKSSHSGFGDIPGYNEKGFRANSLKKIDC